MADGKCCFRPICGGDKSSRLFQKAPYTCSAANMWLVGSSTLCKPEIMWSVSEFVCQKTTGDTHTHTHIPLPPLNGLGTKRIQKFREDKLSRTQKRSNHLQWKRSTIRRNNNTTIWHRPNDRQRRVDTVNPFWTGPNCTFIPASSTVFKWLKWSVFTMTGIIKKKKVDEMKELKKCFFEHARGMNRPLSRHQDEP